MSDISILNDEQYKRLSAICNAAINNRGIAVIAVDGMSAALKTTLTDMLSRKLCAGVIHCDDFFLPHSLRTKERLSEPGGNIHYERMKAEVIDRLSSGEHVVSYNRFDCAAMSLTNEVPVKSGNVYIVEGAYAMHPYFGAYYDASMVLTVSSSKQMERIRLRGDDVSAFRDRWIPMEINYLSYHRILSKADMLIDTSDIG